jgi:hypothetical protein
MRGRTVYRETGKRRLGAGERRRGGRKKREGRKVKEMRKGVGERRRGAGEWISVPPVHPSVMVQCFCGQLLVFNTDLPNLAYNICIQ